MAAMDSTETIETGRALASRLNPFVGYASSGETLENVRGGLEFLSLAACGLADGGSNETAGGLSALLRVMSVALRFEGESLGGTL